MANAEGWGTRAFGISDRLTRLGYGVLVFDLRGHGLSGGEQTSGGWVERLDVLGAVDFLEKERSIPHNRIGLIGFSAGGVAALLAAAEDPRLGAVVVDSAYARLSDVLPHEIEDRTAWPRWVAQVVTPGLLVVGHAVLGVPLWFEGGASAMRRLGIPVLIIHGEEDDRVSPRQADLLLAAARSRETELWIAPGSGHSGAYLNEPSEYIERVAGYFAGRLGEPIAVSDER